MGIDGLDSWDSFDWWFRVGGIFGRELKLDAARSIGRRFSMGKPPLDQVSPLLIHHCYREP
jgi:hypothetical protein